MKKQIRTYIFNFIIIILCIIFCIQLFMIFKNILLIKKENSKLKDKVITLNNYKEQLLRENKLLEEENFHLKNKIDEFHKPKEAPPDTPHKWKVYRFLEYGYEIAYPSKCNIKLSGGHSPVAHPWALDRLDIYFEELKSWLEILPNDSTPFKDINEFIKIDYEDRIIPIENINLSNNTYKIYKSKSSEYYYVFLRNKSFIFTMSFRSREWLIRMLKNFKFI